MGALEKFKATRMSTAPMQLDVIPHFAWTGTLREEWGWEGINWTSDFAIAFRNPHGSIDFYCLFECDGYQWHSDQAAFERDRKKDREAAASGYIVCRFPAAEIMHSPAAVGEDILSVLYAFESHILRFLENVDLTGAGAF